jgi:hypothetical protein
MRPSGVNQCPIPGCRSSAMPSAFSSPTFSSNRIIFFSNSRRRSFSISRFHIFNLGYQKRPSIAFNYCLLYLIQEQLSHILLPPVSLLHLRRFRVILHDYVETLRASQGSHQRLPRSPKHNPRPQQHPFRLRANSQRSRRQKHRSPSLALCLDCRNNDPQFPRLPPCPALPH